MLHRVCSRVGMRFELRIYANDNACESLVIMDATQNLTLCQEKPRYYKFVLGIVCWRCANRLRIVPKTWPKIRKMNFASHWKCLTNKKLRATHTLTIIQTHNTSNQMKKKFSLLFVFFLATKCWFCFVNRYSLQTVRIRWLSIRNSRRCCC